LNPSNFARYQRIAGRVIAVSGLLTAMIIPVMVFYYQNELVLLVGVVSLTFSLITVFSGFYFKFYFKVLGQALQGFEQQPAVASWVIPAAMWDQYQKAEKNERRKGYLAYWMMAPVLMAVIALTLFTELDDLEFNMTLVYLTLGAFVLCMVLLYFNMRSTSLKSEGVREYQITIKGTGVKINHNIHFWGKTIAARHQSGWDTFWATLTVVASAERELTKAEHIASDGLHYILFEFKPDEKNTTTVYVPVPDEQHDNVDAIIGEVLSADTTVAPEVLSPQGGKYNTSKMIKWSVAVVAVISLTTYLVDLYKTTFSKSVAEEVLPLADAAFERGSYDSAKYLYLLAIAESENIPGAWVNLGVIYINNEQYDSAHVSFAKALGYLSDYDLAIYNDAYAYYLEKNYSEAISGFQKYHQLGYGETGSYLTIGDAFYLTNQEDSALNYYSLAYDSGARSAVLSFNIAQILRGKNLPDEAMAKYRECLAQDSTMSDAYISLASVLREKGELMQARELLAKGQQFAAE
jgi:hypothetical protein